MKTVTVSDAARNFRAVLDRVPEPRRQDALAVFGNLYRTLDDETADGASATIAFQRKRQRERVAELRARVPHGSTTRARS
jgi:hypothetical protein